MVIKKQNKQKQTNKIFWLFLLSVISGKVVCGGQGSWQGKNQKMSGTDSGILFFPFFFFGKFVSLVLLNGKICLNWRNGVSCKYCRAGQACVHRLKIAKNFLCFQVLGNGAILKCWLTEVGGAGVLKIWLHLFQIRRKDHGYL